MSERIGFIGLGIMGKGMAHNLLKAGFDLRVWNRTPSRMAELVDAGASQASSPADLAENCDIIIVCVSDTPDVRGVILGEQGVIFGLRPGSLVVDMSTISPQVTRDIATSLAKKDTFMLDAPISGGSEGAALGTLSIMVGGHEEQVHRDDLSGRGDPRDRDQQANPHHTHTGRSTSHDHHQPPSSRRVASRVGPVNPSSSAPKHRRRGR